ncbi:MAG: hypothetical protein ACR2L8_06665, partial [Solirubrobacteraceae bacterium]
AREMRGIDSIANDVAPVAVAVAEPVVRTPAQWLGLALPAATPARAQRAGFLAAVIARTWLPAEA